MYMYVLKYPCNQATKKLSVMLMHKVYIAFSVQLYHNAYLTLCTEYHAHLEYSQRLCMFVLMTLTLGDLRLITVYHQ